MTNALVFTLVKAIINAKIIPGIAPYSSAANPLFSLHQSKKSSNMSYNSSIYFLLLATSNDMVG